MPDICLLLGSFNFFCLALVSLVLGWDGTPPPPHTRTSVILCLLAVKTLQPFPLLPTLLTRSYILNTVALLGKGSSVLSLSLQTCNSPVIRTESPGA